MTAGSLPADDCLARPVDDPASRWGSPARLAELEATGLDEPVAVAALDALTRVAYDALGGVTAMVTAITATERLVVSAHSDAGSGEPLRSSPLTHSLCRFVVLSGQPFVVEDAAADPALRDEPAVRELGVAAYAGYPLHGPLGEVLGSVCAVSATPRAWTPSELQILRSLTVAAEFVVGTLTLDRRARLARIKGVVPLDQFARLQHGIRTPLTSLLGFLDLLLDGTVGDFTDDQIEALERCRHNAERLRQAVNGLR